jgi:hypothetical protein
MLRDIKVQQRGAVTLVWFDDFTADFSQDFLLTADRHHDSKFCNRDLEMKHLEDAKRRNAYIIDCGDLFDAMGGRYDNRRSYDDIRPEYVCERYYDVIVEDAAKHYTPYADNFLLLSRGNHDNSIIKHTNHDMLSQLVYMLNAKRQAPLMMGGYGGYIILYFSVKGTRRSSIKIKYFHGSGGEAPVTRGVIQTNRQAVIYPDADLVLNGHNHHEYTLAMKRERISSHGEVYSDLCWHCRTPGYMDSYADGSSGWEVERGGVPKPQGAIWLNVTYETFGRVSKPVMKLTADVV